MGSAQAKMVTSEILSILTVSASQLCSIAAILCPISLLIHFVLFPIMRVPSSNRSRSSNWSNRRPRICSEMMTVGLWHPRGRSNRRSWEVLVEKEGRRRRRRGGLKNIMISIKMSCPTTFTWSCPISAG